MLKLSQRWFLATLSCVAFGGACGGDEAPPPAPVEYTITIDDLDGQGVDSVKLRCDLSQQGEFTGTLAVTVSYPPSLEFTPRPAFACGSSTRCGYVHLEGLTADGEVLASVDTATRQGVLVFRDRARLPELSQIRATLMRGLDQEPVLNPDDEPVEASVRPTFEQPDCDQPAPGAGGVGGANPGLGGAGSDAGGAGSGLGGAGGANPVEAVGGEAGRAGLGGEAGQAASSGAGGA